MEEYIVIEGIGYILSYPYPLTLDQRNSVIEQIRELNDRIEYISIQESSSSTTFPIQKLSASMHVLAPSCTSVSKQKGGTISLNAAPMGGIAPYTVTYYKKIGTAAPVSIGSQSSVAEAINSTTPSTTTINYTILNDDIKNSTGDPAPNPAQPPYVSAALLASKIRIITQITDSCPTGSQSCIEYCDVNISCLSPTCNAIIT